MEPWMWMVAGLAVTACVVVWCALALASVCDDMQDQLRAERRQTDALARASRNR